MEPDEWGMKPEDYKDNIYPERHWWSRFLEWLRGKWYETVLDSGGSSSDDLPKS